MIPDWILGEGKKTMKEYLWDNWEKLYMDSYEIIGFYKLSSFLNVIRDYDLVLGRSMLKH